MGLWLKQSTAVTLKIGPFIDDTDGKTAETSLTLSQADIRLSKNGGNIAQKNESTSATSDELGYYDCPLDATDTNTLGILQLFVHESGALPVFHEYMVVPANVYNSLILGSASDYLDVAVVELADIDFGATMKASINTEVDNALNTAIPGSPTADSVNERVKAIDDKLPTNYIMGSSVVTAKDDEIDAIKAKTDNLPADPADESSLEAAITAAHSTTDAKIDAVDDYVDTEVAAIKAVTDTLSLTAIADAVHDEVTEGTTTLRQAIKLISSALFAKTSGGGTATLVARDIGDTKNRITVTADADGNRTAVTLDAT